MAIVLALAAALSPARGSSQVLDAIVARVDEEVITWGDVLQEGQLRRLEGRPEEESAPERVRGALVRERLLLAEAQKLRLPADPAAPPEEVARGKDLRELGAYGLGPADLARRASRRSLVDQYLTLRREMTFVPEAEIRAFYGRRGEALHNRPLAEVRDELRAELAERVFEQELERWIERQSADGRVVLNPLPSR